MKPLPPPMYHYEIVFKNGRSLNVISSFAVQLDNPVKWIKFGLEDANNRADWSSVKTVTIRISSIMYIVLHSVDRPEIQNI